MTQGEHELGIERPRVSSSVVEVYHAKNRLFHVQSQAFSRRRSTWHSLRWRVVPAVFESPHRAPRSPDFTQTVTLTPRARMSSEAPEEASSCPSLRVQRTETPPPGCRESSSRTGGRPVTAPETVPRSC